MSECYGQTSQFADFLLTFASVSVLLAAAATAAESMIGFEKVKVIRVYPRDLKANEAILTCKWQSLSGDKEPQDNYKDRLQYLVDNIQPGISKLHLVPFLSQTGASDDCKDVYLGPPNNTNIYAIISLTRLGWRRSTNAIVHDIMQEVEVFATRFRSQQEELVVDRVLYARK
jgi:hypothetical protein